jgi:hypothetical protein
MFAPVGFQTLIVQPVTTRLTDLVIPLNVCHEATKLNYNKATVNFLQPNGHMLPTPGPVV